MLNTGSGEYMYFRDAKMKLENGRVRAEFEEADQIVMLNVTSTQDDMHVREIQWGIVEPNLLNARPRHSSQETPAFPYL